MIRRPPRSTLFPTRRSSDLDDLPPAYVGKSMAEIFALQKQHGASHYEDMTDDVSHAREGVGWYVRSEEHTSELQSRQYLVCRLLLEKKKQNYSNLNSNIADI